MAIGARNCTEKEPYSGGRSRKKKLLHYTIKTLAIRNSKVKGKTKGAKIYRMKKNQVWRKFFYL